MLQTSAADLDLLCWDRRGRLLATNQRDAGWQTQRVPLGWPLMGIWAPGMPDGQTVPLARARPFTRPSVFLCMGVVRGRGGHSVALSRAPAQITAVDRSPCQRFVLTADDLGSVRLLNYPAVVRHAPALVESGHGSFVSAVRWAAAGAAAGAVAAHVVSAGGADRAVFHWTASLPPLRTARQRRHLMRQEVVRNAGAPRWQAVVKWQRERARLEGGQLHRATDRLAAADRRQGLVARELERHIERQQSELAAREREVAQLRAHLGVDYDRSASVQQVRQVRWRAAPEPEPGGPGLPGVVKRH